jgi:hypothetical protein
MARPAGQAVDQPEAEAIAPGVIAAAGDRKRVLQATVRHPPTHTAGSFCNPAIKNIF